MKRFGWVCICCFLLAGIPAKAQFYSAGTDPGAVRWSEIQTANYRLIYPRGTDSLARAYALSLQRQYPRIGRSLGFAPSELCRKPMPVILHPYTSFGNGMVMWAPRRMELYTLGDPSDPDPMPWMLNLTTHEPRHAAQLQFGRRWPFKALRWLVGDLSDVAWWSIYTGIAFSEGDAVVAETALTPFGRGRTADFLEYVRVAFDEGDWRDYWRWRYGSNRLYTPDHYRAGYLLAAGLRTNWDEPLFLKKYHDNLFSRKLPLPFFNMPYTIRQTTGLSFGEAFDAISHDFQAVWAANDSLRARAACCPAPGEGSALPAPDFGQAFVSGTPLTPATRRFSAFRGAAGVGDDIYAVQTGLEQAARLVRIAPDGSVSSLGPFAATASDLRHAAGRLYWSEEIRDPRWELAGTSVIRSMDLASGRKRTLLRGGRDYNPAPTEDGSRVAVMDFPTDGSHRILVLDAGSGADLSVWAAPAGLQPAQAAWIGDALYVSGVTDEGFGIYEASRGWRTVLPGRPVKIKQLRAREGRLWFVCDKNGVNELYSCDPADGTLRQETSLRHGGSQFVWNAAGDTLRYAVLSTEGRPFHSAPAAAFTPRPADWDEIWRHPVAEELSAQERALEAEAIGRGKADGASGGASGERVSEAKALGRGKADGASGRALGEMTSGTGSPADTAGLFITAPKPYRKATHLLRFHTWAPLYIDYDAVADLSLSSLYSAATLGATAFFQNDLATAEGSLGYSARRQAARDWRHLLDLRFTYKGWYPVIETALQISNEAPSRYTFTRLTTDYPVAGGAASAVATGGMAPALGGAQAGDGMASAMAAGGAVSAQGGAQAAGSAGDAGKRTGNQVSATALSGPSVSFSARIYLPLVFSSGGWNRGFIPQLRYALSNNLYDGTVFQGERFGTFPSRDRSFALKGFEPGSSVFLQNLTASVRAYVMRPTAASGVYPRWGIGAELGAGFRPALTHIYDPAVYGYLYGYLPGVLPEHGLKLTALTQKQWSPSAYIQEQRVVTYPRGFAATGGALGRYLAGRYPSQTKWTADYLMAVLPLDWSGLGPVAYVKNFELGLHFDAALYLPAESQEGSAAASLGRVLSGGPVASGGGAGSCGGAVGAVSDGGVASGGGVVSGGKAISGCGAFPGSRAVSSGSVILGSRAASSSRSGASAPAGYGALMSAGGSLSLRLGNLLWIPFDTRIGISWSCNFGPSYDRFGSNGLPLNRHHVSLLFSIDY